MSTKTPSGPADRRSEVERADQRSEVERAGGRSVVERDSRRRVVVVLSHLGPGGTERVAATMAGYWADRGHDVTVVTIYDEIPDFHRLDPKVKRIRLVPRHGLTVRIRRFIAREVIEGGSSATHGEPAAGSPATHGEPAAGSPATHGEPAAGSDGQARQGRPPPARPGRRPLDGLRSRYMALEGLAAALLGLAARHRLLGRSGRAYAALLRVFHWPVRTLRDVLARTDPDVVVSLLGGTNIMTVAASAGLRHRVVISERNDPSRERLDSPWDDLRPIFYPLADAVSANSHGALASMRAYCPEAKLRYVPNPVRLPAGGEDATRTDSVLFLGRLAPQKAPDVLIEAFARFRQAAPAWTLHLAGGGPLAEALRARVHDLGLREHVRFHGVVDPAALLATCRIFVLPSRFEGTPNALLEAMAHRLPCIVSDASPGPLRLIEDGTTGLVVETGSVERLAAAMTTLSRDQRLRRALGDAAHERVRELSLDRVGPVWDRVVFPDDPREPADTRAPSPATGR